MVSNSSATAAEKLRLGQRDNYKRSDGEEDDDLSDEREITVPLIHTSSGGGGHSSVSAL